MKKMSIVTLITVAALVALMVIPVIAQVSGNPPPPPVSSPEVGRYVATPIGGGIVVLLSMIGYGIFRLRNKEQA